MNIFYSTKQGEDETGVKYLQRLMAELFKGKPRLKKNSPRSIKRRDAFLRDRIIAGLNKRYREFLQVHNLDKMKMITFAELQRQAYQIDKCSLG